MVLAVTDSQLSKFGSGLEQIRWLFGCCGAWLLLGSFEFNRGNIAGEFRFIILGLWSRSRFPSLLDCFEVRIGKLEFNFGNGESISTEFSARQVAVKLRFLIFELADSAHVAFLGCFL